MRTIHVFCGVMFLVLGTAMLGSCDSPAAQSAVKPADTQPSGPMQNVSGRSQAPGIETHNDTH